MVVSTGIGNLQRAFEQLRQHGHSAVPQLLAELQELQRTAALEPLSRLCAEDAAAIAAAAQTEGGYQQHAAAIALHLQQVLGFAQRLFELRAEGADLGDLDVPPPLDLGDADDQQHFGETVAMFVVHAIGAVAELEEDILAVESQPDPTESVRAIRRVVHTLKAEFGVLQMDLAKDLCHDAEAAIDAVVEQGRPFPIDLLLELVDWLKQYFERLCRDTRAAPPDAAALQRQLAAILRRGPVIPVDAAVVDLSVGGDFVDSLGEFIGEARAHLADAEAAMVAFEAGSDDTEPIHLTFRAFHTIKGVAGFLNLSPIVQLAHAAETLLDAGRARRLALDAEDVDLILACGDLINQMLNALAGQQPPSLAQHQQLLATLAAAVQRPRAFVAVDAEATAVEATVEATVVTVAPPAAAARPKPATEPRPAPDGETKAPKVERTVKVSTTRLDLLVDMVSELVIAQSMVLQDRVIQGIESQKLARNLAQVGKITRDLQSAAMSLRMVTLKATFQKMARLVRDVAAKAGKKVLLSLQGDDTELDRNVVEQIGDPLVHMIRNAIDHGLESPEDRRRSGKAAEGRLSLRASHQGGAIIIEITDDGRGIPRQRVFDKAMEKGLLPAGTRLEDLGVAEVFGLIFLPGFSTAETVTDLSGRGVGMDVVRRNIEALRGKIEIDSRPGQGTTFRMRLPLTLAIIDGMVVRVGRERYVVPTLSIEQSFRPDRADVHYLADRGECIAVRGAVLPIYRLQSIFGIDGGSDFGSDFGSDLGSGILIVVDVDGARSCLLVDEILGQHQVVIKSLGGQGKHIPGVAGGAIMGDGRIALILDVASLVETAILA